MLTYLLGPVLSLLPQRWRKNLFANLDVDWVRATLVSGVLCGAGCLLGLAVWYMAAIKAGIDAQVDVTLIATKGAPGRGTGMVMGFASYMAFLLHPLTWVLGYFSAEGIYRAFAAAINDEAPGSGPLCVHGLDNAHGAEAILRETGTAGAGPGFPRRFGEAVEFESGVVPAKAAVETSESDQVQRRFFSRWWGNLQAERPRHGRMCTCCARRRRGKRFAGWRFTIPMRRCGPQRRPSGNRRCARFATGFA